MKASPISTEEILHKLSTADPITDHDSPTSRQLQGVRDEIADAARSDSTTTRLATPHPSAVRTRSRWARPLLAAAVIVPVAVAVGLTLYPRERSQHSSTVATSGLAAAAVVPPKYQQIAARYAPQTQHFTVECGGQTVPVAMLAAPAGAENSPGAAADALRNFFRNNPFAGMGAVTSTGWVLLAESSTNAIFGQRTGPIGVGTVIVFSRHGQKFSPQSETGCSTVHTGADTVAEPITSVTATGTTLTLQWQASTNCGDGPARTARVTDQVTVLETATNVRILLTSRPATDAGATRGACAGASVTATATARLHTPLGNRQILDDARVPSTPITHSP